MSGSAAPADLETALQLLYQEFTAPGDDPEAFALMRRQLEAAIANRAAVARPGVRRAPVAGQHLRPLHVEAADARARIASLDRAKMLAFYRARFANAADFTFFMVGAFKVDEALPLLARYVGVAAVDRRSEPSQFKDVGICFPDTVETRDASKRDASRASQTVISFFADPAADPVEQEHVIAATTVLETALRDILREELGQTYTVVGRPVATAAAARLRPHRGQLRRRAREHRRDDRSRAAGDQAAAGRRAVGRSDDAREGRREARTTRPR